MPGLVKKILSWIWPLTLEKVKGSLDHELEVTLYRGKLYLDTATVNYSYGSLENVFDHAFEESGIYGREIDSALILGLGAGCVAGLLHRKNSPSVKCTGIEIDPEIIYLYRKYFDVSGKDIHVIQGNAVDFVRSCETEYDLVIVDVFVNAIVPSEVQSEDFLRGLRKVAGTNGKIFFNMIIPDTMPGVMDEFVRKFENNVGPALRIITHFSGAQNCVLVA